MHEQHRVNSYPACNESSPNLADSLVLPLLFRISLSSFFFLFYFPPLLLLALCTPRIFSFKGTTCTRYWSIDVCTRCAFFQRIPFLSFITHTLNTLPRTRTSTTSFDDTQKSDVARPLSFFFLRPLRAHRATDYRSAKRDVCPLQIEFNHVFTYDRAYRAEQTIGGYIKTARTMSINLHRFLASNCARVSNLWFLRSKKQ